MCPKLGVLTATGENIKGKNTKGIAEAAAQASIKYIILKI